MIKNNYLVFSAGLIPGALPGGAAAQTDTFPTQPLRIIVPFAPGGSVDLISRLIAPKMGELLGQQIIVDNRADASGNIGSEMLARAVSPDQKKNHNDDESGALFDFSLGVTGVSDEANVRSRSIDFGVAADGACRRCNQGLPGASGAHRVRVCGGGQF